MNFAKPMLLWLLAAATPLLAWFLWWSQRRRQQLATQFIAARLLDALSVGVSRRRQAWRSGLIGVSVLLIIAALARPQWGFNWEEAKQEGLDILVAIDTSRSMLATDIAPNRLERAKLEALSLMGRAKTDRLGLIAFAGSAFLQCPLTLDDEAFRQSVIALDTSIIPQGGTAIADAIQTATSAFKDSGDNHKVLILLTDGEDHEPGAIDAARAAAHEGVRIFTIGLGTSEGQPLRLRDEKGAEAYVKDDAGNVVVSRLNENLLTAIATEAKGFYLNLRGAGTMDTLYQQGLAQLPKREFTAKLVKRLHEKYHWPLGLAVLLLIAEIFIPERSRRTAPVRRSAIHLEAETIKAGVAVLCLFAASASASESSAYRAYESRQFDNAAKEYQSLASKRPNDTRLNYNAGAAAYQAGRFDVAADLLQRAMATSNRELQERALYNLGNTRYRQGEQAEKLEDKRAMWEASMQSYEAAAKLNPGDGDAKFNHELVKKKLEELKRQQQQQQSQQNQQQNQKDKQDDKNQEKKDQQSAQNQQQQQKQEQKADQQKDQQQKAADQKADEKKDRQQAANQQQQKDEKREGQPQPKDGGKDQQQAQAQNQSGKPDDKDKQEGASQRQVALGVMTPEQAQQLLESLKGEEGTLVFRDLVKTNAQGRLMKDW